jgi:aminoglycoside phosphotransferase (APT) family kinase protein
VSPEPPDSPGRLRPLVDEKVLVHGDYQHFNVLWSQGRLTGVVDWPNAGTGNRGSDVGHCRLNLAVLFGPSAAADYQRHMRVRPELLWTGERTCGRCSASTRVAALHPAPVARRAPLDVAGMPGRVAAAIRDSLDAVG